MLGAQRVKRKSLVGVLTAPQTFEISLTLDADPSPSSKPDPEAGSKTHPEAGSKSHPEGGSTSHAEAGSKAGADGGAEGGAEAGLSHPEAGSKSHPEAGLQRADAGQTRLVSVTMGVLAQVLKPYRGTSLIRKTLLLLLPLSCKALRGSVCPGSILEPVSHFCQLVARNALVSPKISKT